MWMDSIHISHIMNQSQSLFPKFQSSSKTHLVDEQYDLPLAVLDPVDYLLQPLLELPAVACARDERAHVEADQPAVPQRVGHVAGVYPLGDPLGDGGLACTRRRGRWEKIRDHMITSFMVI